MKLRQKSKILAAAVAMMTFSTAAAVTGTVAWFTASNMVSVSGMSIQADTEQGILIANESNTQASDWAASAIASHNGEISVVNNTTNQAELVQAKFIPTSTYDATKWYHANSSSFDLSQSVQTSDKYAYFDGTSGHELGENGSSTGVYQIKASNLAITNKNLYLLNKFYIKSSTIEGLDASKLYVNEVNASVNGTANSAELNKALRVLVTCACNSTTYKAFFAPLETTTVEYTIGGSDLNPVQKYTPVAKDVKDTELVTSALTIPGSNSTPLEIKVYVYFEGEDENCKSANITASLDKIALDLKFGTQRISNN